MKSKMIRSAVTGLLMLSISVPVFATWYQDQIVIPVAGMMTTARPATSGVQYTQVKNNVYNVYSRIDNSSKTGLSSFVLNPAGTPTVKAHLTAVSTGTSVRAEFKAASATSFPTVGLIRWEP